jgi:hypothetical protein
MGARQLLIESLDETTPVYFEFYTNATGTISFSVTNTGPVAVWFINGTRYASNTPSHNFGGASGTKLVRLQNAGDLLAHITEIDIHGCAVTELVTTPAFAALTSFKAYTNPGLTMDLADLPATWVAMETLYLYGTGVTCTGFPEEWVAIADIRVDDDAWSEAEVDAFIEALYDNRMAWEDATPEANVAGDNAEVSLTAFSQIEVLENDPLSEGFNPWVVEYNLSYQLLNILGSDLKAGYSSLFSEQYEESTPVTPVSNGSVLGYFTDLSGNGYHMSQGTTVNKATYNASDANFNGRPSWSFGGDDWYQLAFGTTYSQPNMILAVFRLSSILANRVLFDGENISARHYIDYSTTNTHYRVFAGSLADTGFSADANAHIFYLVFNGANSIAYLDGVPSAALNPGVQSLTGLTLGTRYDKALGWLGQVTEVALIDNLPTSAQLNQVGAIWSSLYGISYTPIV